MLDHLEPNRLYAIQYTYGKQSPFVYEESRRFVVDTSGERRPSYNAALNPVQFVFDYGPEKNGRREPRITARIDRDFSGYEVGVDLEPFCSTDRNQGSHFWLSAKEPSHEIKGLPLVDAVCDSSSSSKKHSLCPSQRILSASQQQINDSSTNQHQRNNRDSGGESAELQTVSNNQIPWGTSQIPWTSEASATTAVAMPKRQRCPLGSDLCYIASLLVHGKIFSMPKRCVDVAQRLPEAPITQMQQQISTQKSTPLPSKTTTEEETSSPTSNTSSTATTLEPSENGGVHRIRGGGGEHNTMLLLLLVTSTVVLQLIFAKI